MTTIPKDPQRLVDAERLNRLSDSLRSMRLGLQGLNGAGERLTGAVARMNPLAPNPFGWSVVTTPMLPGSPPSPGEEARRIVRHGLASVTLHGKPLVDPGPAPGARTHIIAVPAGRYFLVSREMYERLMLDPMVSRRIGPPDDPTLAASMRRAQTQAEVRQDRVGVWMTDDEL